MSQRPLAIVSGLTIGDYLLWNWSLNHSYDVSALISGLTLPPLAIATAWLLVLGVARLLARTTRRSTAQPGAAGGRTPRRRPKLPLLARLTTRRAASARRAALARTGERAPGTPSSPSPASTSSTSSSRKLAA